MAHQSTISGAVVGCGYWGINYARLFSELPQVELKALCDLSQKRLEELEKRFPKPYKTSELNQIIQDKSIQAVVVCTNPADHFQTVRALLEAGKHVLVEKPMTTSSEDGLNLIELAHEKGLILMVGHIFLYHECIRKMKEYISRKTCGEVYYIYTKRTNLGPIRNDVNALWDLAPHDIYIINYLLDMQPQWVSAIGSGFLRKPCCEDVGFITLGYPNGVIGNIHVSWANPHKEREIVVVGSQQRIVFDDTSVEEKLKVFEKGVTSEKEPLTFGEYQLSIRDGDIIIPNVRMSEPLKSQVLHFIECIQQGIQPLTNGKNGLEVVEVLEAMDKSMISKGVPQYIQSTR